MAALESLELTDLENLRTELSAQNLFDELARRRYDNDHERLMSGASATEDMLRYWGEHANRAKTASTLASMFKSFAEDRANIHLLLEIIRSVSRAIESAMLPVAGDWRYGFQLRCPVCDEWMQSSDMSVFTTSDARFSEIVEEADPQGRVDYTTGGYFMNEEPVILHISPVRGVAPCLIKASSLDWEPAES